MNSIQKNDHITGECIGYTSEGLGVVKVDGFPLFVKGMLKGEVGELIITLMKKTYGFAKLWRCDVKSKERIKPACAVANSCGGCQLQHMSYAEQLRFKQQKVQDVMNRIAKLDHEVLPVLENKQQEWYRNKCQIPVGIQKHRVVTGFYRVNSNTIIDTDACRMQSERINEVLKHMRYLLQKYGNAQVFRHILIKHAFQSGEVMVVWITKTGMFSNRDAMVLELVEKLPYIKSVIVNVNTRNDNVILGEREIKLYGQEYICDAIHDLKFHISSKSFYQVNPIQTEVLYSKVLEFCQLQGEEHVLDLYCGVGTISMFLAQQAKQVTGIEIIPEAVQDAKRNANLNHIENITFVCSDAATFAKESSAQGFHPDVIVVDPPRKGCDSDTLRSMVKMQPKRIVYVSCDPATQARDLRYLCQEGYQVEIIQPVDMFSFSHHIEVVIQMMFYGDKKK